MSEMSDTDIVSELRKLHAEILASDEGRECEMMALVRKSADEIERLRRKLAALSEGRDTSPVSVPWVYTPPYIAASDEIKRLHQQRDELLAIAKRYAAECRLCGGHSVRRRLDVDGVPLDDVACEQCADVRLVIARAEGRGDG